MFSSEINRNSALKDDKWRSIINGTEQNWYLEHRTDYGSIKWIKWRMIIYAFTAVLAFGFQKNLDYFQFNWWNSVTLNTAYWISYIWRFGYAQVVPFCIFLYIFRYLSILDDAIGLRKEVKNIAVLFTIINILMFIIPMSSLIISTFFLDIWDTYYELISLITLINTFVVRILYFIINYKGTRWVVSKFGYMHRDRSGTGFKDSSTISLSLTRMRNITFNDNTVTLLNARNNSMSLNLEELERFIEMKQILSSNIEFDRFMRHLVKEYNAETMLSIIEMTQFKQMIYDRELDQNQRTLISQSKHGKYTNHFLQIPSECPESSIVFDEDQRKTLKAKARDIYLKYLMIGGPHEVCLEWKTRYELSTLIESDEWTSHEEDEDPWNL